MIKLKTAIKLSELYWPSFIEINGAVFIESELQKSNELPERSMLAECFVNHVHILDKFNHKASLDEEPWWNSEHEDFKSAYELAKTITTMWACKLKHDFPHHKFVVICTREDNPVIRFHMLRKGQGLYFQINDLNVMAKNDIAKVVYTDDV